jgi:acyl-homoserine lactone synthase
MIFVVDAGNRQLFESDLAQMHRQRKAVFVDSIGWKLPVVIDMEIDRYDRDDTLYLLAKDRPDGEVLASVRLLATDGPHLMCDLFAPGCGDATPRGPAIWEVSRFCTAPALGRRARLRLLWEVTCAVMETALLHRIDQVVFAANRALLPLMLNCGWRASVWGPTLPDQDDEVTAVVAQISVEGLRRVRQRHRVAAPALHSTRRACAEGWAQWPACAAALERASSHG